MLSKNKIKFINSLKKKKSRTESGLFLAEGAKLVAEVLSSDFHVPLLFATPEWMNASKLKNQANIKEVIAITQEELNRISTQKNPNQVMAVVEQPHHKIIEEELTNNLSLILDSISDPGNLGTIIRIGDWFGIYNLICSHATVDVYNPKVIQSTMGSICRVKVHYRDLKEVLSKYHNISDFNIYGSFLRGENMYETELSNNGFIVMGNEAQGISKELMPYIDNKLYIPNYAGKAEYSPESLNVSVATGIICSEFRRRGEMK
ncbi:MAG: TrmH family RNA methyltransferase [Bacteroidota bacterium]